MQKTDIRKNCARYDHKGQWGIVEFNGSEWLAELAFYQKTGSRGPIKKPKSQRMPRYRRIGFYPERQQAVDALCRVLDPLYASAMALAGAEPVKISPQFAERYAKAKLKTEYYGKLVFTV